MCLFKCITSLVSENPFAVNVLTNRKNSWNMQKRYCYATFSSFCAKLSYKKLFLIRSESLGPLFNTLTANYEYFRSNRENWPSPIQIKWYKKPSIFRRNFCCSFGIYIKFSMLWKINEPHRSSISWSFWLRKMYLFKRVTGLVS